MLHLKKTPQELLQRIKGVEPEAVDEFCQACPSRTKQDRYADSSAMGDQLSQNCWIVAKKKEGFSSFQEQCEQRAYQALPTGVSYQAIAIQQIQAYLDFLAEDSIGRYWLCTTLLPIHELSLFQIPVSKLAPWYRHYLGKLTLKVEEYFMGICDTSYCALERKSSKLSD